MAAKEPDLVPVISREIRNTWLGSYTHKGPGASDAKANDQRAQVTPLLILPGLNFIDPAKLKAVGPMTGSNIRLKVQDPTTLDAHEARELLGITASKDAVRKWRALESEPARLAMLDERLHGSDV